MVYGYDYTGKSIPVSRYRDRAIMDLMIARDEYASRGKRDNILPEHNLEGPDIAAMQAKLDRAIARLTG